MSAAQYGVVGLCLALIGLGVFLFVRMMARMSRGKGCPGCSGCSGAFGCRGCAVSEQEKKETGTSGGERTGPSDEKN